MASGPAARGGRQAPRLGTDPSPTVPSGPASGSVVDRLVAAATRLFANQGYERTTVQEVVVAAGVTKGAMYHYFTSKDDLLHEIYHRILTMQLERLRAFADDEGPIDARLREAAVDVIATTVDNFDDLTVVARCMHLLAPPQQRAVRSERRRYHETFRHMVAEGQRAGMFASEVDADLVVDFFFGAVHHLPMWFRPDGRLSGQALGEAYADLLLRALAPLDRTVR
ncbi:MAG: TetR/AcrR family transcriptional regulator [Actinobacteria bacterium]|nr:TetR/AcrR family transcriptional regulator [Actinomycetota bacterium]